MLPFEVAIVQPLDGVAPPASVRVEFADAQQDNAKQVSDVENFLTKQIDLLIISPNEATPLTSVRTNKVGVYTLVHCTESRAKFDTNRVWDSMWWWYKTSAEFILKWEMAHLPPEAKEKAFPLLKKQAEGDFDITEFDRQDMVIIGTPEECLQKFLRYEEAGIDQVLCYVNFGYLPHEAVMKSIQLLGTRVIPELKKRGANNVGPLAASGAAGAAGAVHGTGTVRATTGPRTPPPEEIVSALVSSEVGVRGFSVEGMSLEERFVELTGEGFDIA